VHDGRAKSMNRTFHDTETRWYERLVEVGSGVCVPFNDASRTSGQPPRVPYEAGGI